MDEPEASAPTLESAAPASRVSAIAAAALLAAATVATAWSGYQSARWSGELLLAFGDSTIARLDAQDAATEAVVLQGIDNQQWFAWRQAEAEGNEELAAELRETMRPEFRPAFEEWRQLRGSTPAAGIPVPFELDSYVLEARERSEALNQESVLFGEQAAEFKQRSDNYVLLTVIFASVLFFVGMAQVAGVPHGLHRAMMVGASLLFVAAVVLMLTFPVSIEF